MLLKLCTAYLIYAELVVGIENTSNSIEHTPIGGDEMFRRGLIPAAGIARKSARKKTQGNFPTVDLTSRGVWISASGMAKVDPGSIVRNESPWSVRHAGPPPHRLTATKDCLTLNVKGFPLPVHELLKRFPTKREYFDHIIRMGYNKSMKLEPRGRATMLENTCPSPSGPKQFIFVGDCMAAQSQAAYLRNRKAVTDRNVQDIPNRKRDERLEHMVEDMVKLEENMISQSTEGLESAAQNLSVVSRSFKDAVFVFWDGGAIEQVIAKCRVIIQKNGWDPSSVTVWAHVGNLPFFRGRREWISDRETQLRKFVTKFRAEFSGIRLAWMTANHIDMEIMGAKPSKDDFWFFDAHNISRLTAGQVAVDEMVMKSLGVAVVPRADVSVAYSGLQCDGLHHAPHSKTHAESWHCPGYPAVEDLILQAGLASLCNASAFQLICQPS